MSNIKLNHSRHLNGVNPYSKNILPKSKLEVIDLNSTLDFGKYIGMKVKDAIRLNPDYFRWLIKNTTKQFDADVIKLLKSNNTSL